MAYKVLIVDDSTFFRRRIKQILEEDTELEVVGEAKDGEEALALVKSLNPDVVTMDVEMPVMDGITAVKNIMAYKTVPIIMFSSLTHEGAQSTFDALDAGAVDFLPKKFEDIARNKKDAVTLLQNRVKALCSKQASQNNDYSQPKSSALSALRRRAQIEKVTKAADVVANTVNQSSLPSGKCGCIGIGTSTGGPVAIQQILTKLPADFPVPVVLVQHMPGTFTQAFAKRLNELCEVKVKEAENGDILQAGTCYLAPGGKQMTLEGRPSQPRVLISEPEKFPRETYKPSVDVTFESLGNVYGGNVLAIILTGMGTDGKDGCKSLKDKGAKIWAQDEKSSVVYGMPAAVTINKISEASFDIVEMANQIKKEILA
ncbi:protein-glutamate methylesterase/protein-glutamine glutaminase [Paraglaciecola aestuariivivens]